MSVTNERTDERTDQKTGDQKNNLIKTTPLWGKIYLITKRGCVLGIPCVVHWECYLS